ncbi:MAG: InlB B-repeat-containing protein [Defluviitaleaceae bacterium]|nr:InlB B-repeat-containing protein [Defluviitaleaceae bacterium]
MSFIAQSTGILIINEGTIVNNGELFLFTSTNGLTNNGIINNNNMIDNAAIITNNGTINNSPTATIIGSGTITGNTPNTPPTITTTSLPNGTVATPYSQDLTATGFPSPIWSITSGSLPSGLTLNGNTISGTPTQTGTFNFRITAQNAAGSHYQDLQITITSTQTTTHTVTFALNGGTYQGNQSLLSQTINQGGNATPLTSNPTRNGYTFNGWQPALNLNNITENRTFTAIWQAIETIEPDPQPQQTHAATPRITQQPQSIELIAGSTHTLSVTATSSDNGTLTYQWYKADGATGGFFAPIQGATNNELTIDTTTPSTTRINRYRVIITNNNNANQIDRQQHSTNNIKHSNNNNKRTTIYPNHTTTANRRKCI